MKKTLLILLATWCATMAFGQTGWNKVILYDKPIANSPYLLIDTGGIVYVEKQISNWYRIIYNHKQGYLNHVELKNVHRIDSIEEPDRPMTKLPVDSLTGKITFMEIVRIDTTTARNELYTRAREWFAKTYNSSQEVIQMDDKEAGKIVGKASIEILEQGVSGKAYKTFVDYLISISIKDGRYKYEITNFTCRDTHFIEEDRLVEAWLNSEWYILSLYQINRAMNTLITSLKQAMVITSIKNGKDDW